MLFWAPASTDVHTADVQISNLGRGTNRDSCVSLGKRRSLFSHAILSFLKELKISCWKQKWIISLSRFLLLLLLPSLLSVRNLQGLEMMASLCSTGLIFNVPNRLYLHDINIMLAIICHCHCQQTIIWEEIC